jgi:hypothetical protein
MWCCCSRSSIIIMGSISLLPVLLLSLNLNIFIRRDDLKPAPMHRHEHGTPDFNTEHYSKFRYVNFAKHMRCLMFRKICWTYLKTIDIKIEQRMCRCFSAQFSRSVLICVLCTSGRYFIYNHSSLDDCVRSRTCKMGNLIVSLFHCTISTFD